MPIPFIGLYRLLTFPRQRSHADTWLSSHFLSFSCWKLRNFMNFKVEKYSEKSIRWRKAFSFSFPALFFSKSFKEDNQVVFCLAGKRLKLGWVDRIFFFFFFEKRKRDLFRPLTRKESFALLFSLSSVEQSRLLCYFPSLQSNRDVCFAIFPLFSRTWKADWPLVTSSVLLTACFGQMQQTWRPLRLRLHEVTARCVENRGKWREFEAIRAQFLGCLTSLEGTVYAHCLFPSLRRPSGLVGWRYFFLQSPGRVSWLFVCASLSAPVKNRLVQLCIWLLPICPKLLLLKTKHMVHWC